MSIRFQIMPDNDGQLRVGIVYATDAQNTTYLLSSIEELIMQGAHAGSRKIISKGRDDEQA